jgi:hypothetical protein
MENLSSLDRVLFVLVFNGNPDGSKGVTSDQQRILLLFQASVEHA